MILVISNIINEDAPAWVNSFPAGAASLITASDFHLSFKAGIFVNDFSSSSLTLNGTILKPRDISGIIVTVTGFLPIEFYYIDPSDREYVCIEVNSFVNYFLSELKCKKMNPPTRRSLAGLSFQKIEWVKIAHNLNIPVMPFLIRNGKYEYPEKKRESKVISCTIIGDRVMESDTTDSIQKYVRMLAKTFSLPYLTCHFLTENNRTFHLMDISSIPDISNPLYRQAMINYFQNP